jgi:hypothetical protein
MTAAYEILHVLDKRDWLHNMWHLHFSAATIACGDRPNDRCDGCGSRQAASGQLGDG